jgi:phospholipid-binding lipoprotein MlaA
MLEDFNIIGLEVNVFLDEILLTPIATLYSIIFPDEIQRSVKSFVNFTKTPMIIVNDILQLNKRFFNDIARLMLNFPTLGFYDIASDLGIPYKPNDLSKTFYSYGMENGEYFMVPVVGPYCFLEIIATVAENIINPFNILLKSIDYDNVQLGIKAVSIVDIRVQYHNFWKKLKNSSIDLQNSTKAIYLQMRESFYKEDESLKE